MNNASARLGKERKGKKKKHTENAQQKTQYPNATKILILILIKSKMGKLWQEVCL